MGKLTFGRFIKVRKYYDTSFVLLVALALLVVLILTFSRVHAVSGISVDADVFTHQSSNSGTIKSPAFSTTQAKEVILAFIGSDGPNKSGGQTFSSVTGGGLTWTLRQRSNSQAGDAEIWQTTTTSTLSNVTVTATRSKSGYQGSINVVSFAGADTANNGAVAGASAANGAPSVTLTTTRNNSWVWGTGDDWDNSVSHVVGSNQTLFDQYLDNNTGDTYWMQYLNSPTPTSGTKVVLNDTLPTTDRWNFASIEILPANNDTTPPTAPTNLTATANSATQATLTWTASTDNVGVTGYNVYRSTTSGFIPSPSNLIGTSIASSYTDTTVPGTYYYIVEAYDAAGNLSPASNQASVTLTDITPPNTPTNLQVTEVNSAQVNLSWASSTDNVGVTGYNVYRNGATVGTSTTTSYSDLTVSPGNTYLYTVSAYDAAGNTSQQSSAVSITVTYNYTQPIVTISSNPPAITNNTSASITFNASNSSDPSGTLQYQCSLDNAVPTLCTSPQIYVGLSDGMHSFNVTATDTNDGLTSNPAYANWIIDTIPPSVGITDPTDGATVSATTLVSANASDNNAITSVQFQLDGANLGSAIVSSPYNFNWNTQSTPNGLHTLTAIATDSAGNSTTSSSIMVTVNNTASAAPTIDASTPAATAVQNNITTTTSPNFSPPANSVIYAVFSMDSASYTGSVTTVSSITNSGSHLTWHLLGRNNNYNSTTGGFLEVWWAYNPNSQTNIATTATFNQATKNVTSPVGDFQILVMDNAASDQSAAAWNANWLIDSTNNSPTVSVTTSAANSQVFGVFDNWNNSQTPTPGGNQSVQSIVLNSADVDGYWIQKQNLPTATPGTNVTMNATDPGQATQWRGIAWEVLAAGTISNPGSPTTPSNLAAGAISNTSVALSWNPSTDSKGSLAGYNIYRNGVKVASVNASTNVYTTNYIDTSLSANTTYSYTISAYDTNGNNSAQSLPVTATTQNNGGNVIFSDNFPNNSLNPAWTVISRHGEYSQLETECNVPQEVSVANNMLTISTIAQNTSCGDFNLDGSVRHAPQSWPYATGDVQWTSFNFTYGTVTYTAKFPNSNTSTWPAIWLLGSNCQASNIVTADVGWGSCPGVETPNYTEIDMTECDTNGKVWCQLAFAQPSSFPVCGYPVDNNWHTFSMTWDSTGIYMSIDGKSTGCSYTKAKGYTIPSTPMFLIMQTQTGGVGGTPNNANLPTQLQISNVTVTQP